VTTSGRTVVGTKHASQIAVTTQVPGLWILRAEMSIGNPFLADDLPIVFLPCEAVRTMFNTTILAPVFLCQLLRFRTSAEVPAQIMPRIEVPFLRVTMAQLRRADVTRIAELVWISEAVVHTPPATPVAVPCTTELKSMW